MLKDSIVIDATPERVWFVVEDPQCWNEWNPKIRKVEPLGPGSRGVGYQVRVEYAMKGRASRCLSVIEEYLESERIVFRLTEGNISADGYVREIYELKPVAGGTRMTQRVDMRKSGLNPLLRLLIEVVHRIGKPTGKRNLERLKEIAESLG